jgi:hypothetical protein
MALHAELIYDGFALKIPANPHNMHPTAERLNYVSVDTASGRPFTVNLGPTRVNSVVSWKCVSYSIAKAYEDFLLKKIRLGLRPFTIVCPDYLDFGYGKGMAIPGAYYSGPASLGDIIKPDGNSGLYYDIDLPYMFVREGDYE